MLTSLQKIVAPEKIVALMPQPFADHFQCMHLHNKQPYYKAEAIQRHKC